MGGSFPGCSDGKKIHLQCKRAEFDPWIQSRKWQPTPVFLLGKLHGQKSLAGYSPEALRTANRWSSRARHLECEVKWALGNITTNKASGCDGIPVELFQILIDDAVKVLHSICQQMENSAVATGMENVSFHSNPKERQC